MTATINASTSAGVVVTSDTSGSLALQTNSGTTALTIDTSQNVGIGTSSPAAKFELSTGGGTKLRVTSTIDNNADIEFYTNSTKQGIIEYNSLYGLMYTIPSLPLLFGTANTERMRIDSSGNLLVGATSQPVATYKLVLTYNGNSNNGGIMFNDTDSGVTYEACYFRKDSVQRGYIRVASTGTTYATVSDYRLKENVEPMTGALAKVVALNPCTYTWKDSGISSQGFVAHELQEVVPECVTGEKDAVDADGNPVYQGIDTSFLVATLTAAIQEQQALITALTARITALENPPAFTTT